MTRSLRIAGRMISIAMLGAGCGSSGENELQSAAPAADTGAAPTAQAPATTPSAPVANAGAAATPPNPMTAAVPPVAPAASDTPAAPSDPAMMQSPTTTAPTMGGPGARYPDACSERRGSWSKPCSDDPDPCHLNSGYAGDEYCLLPPPAGQGVQIHFGPKDYKDMADVSKYLLKAGQEFNSYGIVNIPTTETKYFSYLKISMRPGSHHLINTLISGHPEEGFVDGGCEGSSNGGFPGTQNLITESPPQGIPAPENEGLGRTLPGNSSICQNYHRYNTSDQTKLSEIWYNVWFVDEQDITQKSSGMAITAGPWTPIPAHTETMLTTTSTVSGDGRIISLFGHRHAATERFAAYHNGELVYDSWDWVESRLFNYDSITTNPPVNPAAMMDGATSGPIQLKRGDQIKIECYVNNTTDQPLRFANELYTGEMCILFGTTVGVSVN